MLFLSLFVQAFAQDNNAKNVRVPKWLMGVTLAPNSYYLSYSLSNNLQSRPRIGYTTGLNIHNVNSRFGLDVGVYYSRNSRCLYMSPVDSTVFRFSSFGLTPLISEGATAVKLIDIFHCFSLPVKITYRLGGDEVRITASAGLVPQLQKLVASKSQIQFQQKPTEKNRGNKLGYASDFGMSALASLNWIYQLNDRLHLGVEPTFSYGFEDILNRPIVEHQIQVVLNMTCYFILR